MAPETASCTSCRVHSVCLPFRLRLAGEAEASVARRILALSAGEHFIDIAEPDVIAVRDGWCARYVMFPDGRRQITDIVLPGEFVGCSEIAAVNGALPMVALSNVEVCVLDREQFLAAVTKCPRKLMEVMKECGVQALRLRNLVAAMGKQSGAPRIAACLASLHRRLLAIGQALSHEMPYYLKQKDLGDMLGMTQVHVSRTLRMLGEAGVLKVGEKTLSIQNPQELERLARG